jgi:hypothetical protein
MNKQISQCHSRVLTLKARIFNVLPGDGTVRSYPASNFNEAMMIKFISISVMIAGILSGQAALADVNLKDIQVAAKTFSFINPPVTGTIKIAIVFDASIAQSQADAEALKGILGSGLVAGQATLVPVMMPLDQVDKGLDGMGAVFVTSGLSAHFDRIFTASKAMKLLSVSTDSVCVQAGRCVMGVKTAPKVEIVISKAAAEASSITFGQAFRMMISEI